MTDRRTTYLSNVEKYKQKLRERLREKGAPAEDPRIMAVRVATEALIHNLEMDLDDVVYFATNLRRGHDVQDCAEKSKIEEAAALLCKAFSDMTLPLAFGEIAYRATRLALQKGSSRQG